MKLVVLPWQNGFMHRIRNAAREKSRMQVQILSVAPNKRRKDACVAEWLGTRFVSEQGAIPYVGSTPIAGSIFLSGW